MPQSRRMELAEIIKQFHLLVIEDDIYSFLSVYGHSTIDAKPFFSLMPEQTVHICSISKSLCAGLRDENKSSYVRVSVASPDTEDDLRKGLLILKSIFEEKQVNFFV